MNLETNLALIGWVVILVGLIAIMFNFVKIIPVFFIGLGLALQAQHFLIVENYTQKHSPHILWIPIVTYFVTFFICYLLYRKGKEQKS